jgi:hypothetical protein
MKPPIFLLDGDDVLAFRSTGQAETFVEVVNGDELVFDSEGTRLRFEAAGTQRGWPGYIVALRVSPEPRDPERLRQALTEALSRVGPRGRTSRVGLPELVADAADAFDVEEAMRPGSRVTRQLTWLLVVVGIILGVIGVGLLVLVLMAFAGSN